MSVTVQEVWEALTPEEREGFELCSGYNGLVIVDTNDEAVVYTRRPGGMVGFSGALSGRWTNNPQRAIALAREALVAARQSRETRARRFAIEQALRAEEDIPGVRLVAPDRLMVEVTSPEHARAVVRALRGVEVDGG